MNNVDEITRSIATLNGVIQSNRDTEAQSILVESASKKMLELIALLPVTLKD